MKKVTTITDIHHILLNLAKVFHDICLRNDIPYYMMYGTMLGAVRHRGFIPWDDDMDFAVEYKYYRKLVDALKTELPEPYKVYTRYDEGGAVGGYLKIVNTNSIVKENNKLSEDENTGLFIDVFLLYNTPSTSIGYLITRILLIVQHFRFYKITSNRLWKKTIDIIIKALFAKLKRYQIYNCLEKHIFPKESNCYTTHASIYGKKDFISKVYYGKPTLYTFVDTELYGVENADKYLTILYGDYMQLPPMRKRMVHLQEAYILEE